MQTPDTQRTVTFFFEGRALRGIEGEPIAKALFTAGVRTLSHSVKYKRPRGIFCARGRCVACHMSVDGVPGVPTCITPLREGMRIEREGYPPFYSPLATAFIRLFPFPAGFYYRMFTRPAWLQKIFLGSLRRMAGVGRIPLGDTSIGPTTGAGRNTPLPLKDAYDVVVVGSGVSGMAAALSSAHHGSEVLLVDECRAPGGHSIGHQFDTELASARDRLIERIKGHVAVERRPGIVAYGFYPPNTLLLGPGGEAGMKRVLARSFVFATGANDVVPLFENNDTPGIFGERAIRLLLERDRWQPGKRAVIYGAGPSLQAAAGLLLHHGIDVAAAVDPTDSAPEEGNLNALRGIRTIANAKIAAASGGAWLRAVSGVQGAGREKFSLDCDLLCIALPGQPAYELPHQAGFEYALSESPIEELEVMRPVTRFRTMGPEPGRGAISLFIVGDASGDSDWRTKIEGGERAGAQAARAARA